MSGIWSSLLDSASSAKSVPTRTLLLIGGTAQCQRDFINQLVQSVNNDLYAIQGSYSAVKNDYAIGYLYIDVYDREQEELIIRLHIYTVSKLHESYANLLVNILNREETTFESLFVTILCDWTEPRRWIRDIAQTILFLRNDVISKIDQEKFSGGLARCSERYNKLANTSFTDSFQLLAGNSSTIEVPLGKGEFDAPLGIQFMVAVMNSERTEVLERQFGRKDDEFDFIQQFLRTILLKHGASLIYLSSDSKTLFPLLFYLLSPSITVEHSRDYLKEAAQFVKPNVIQRDAVLIPSGWDSWSKILVIKEDFDVEGVSSSWQSEVLAEDGDVDALIEVFEEVVHAFGAAVSSTKEVQKAAAALEVESVPTQQFLRECLAELSSVELNE
ncbi:dynein light intermediate chain-domain-containing protein [Myxozyma melibiosi]|uniref:Dynein light intermediate chain-domain-containing protein n=1 Tax=Myxozyma melibiosi TaxID=54550 RepID=A0ABR1F1E5_9ASCO